MAKPYKLGLLLTILWVCSVDALFNNDYFVFCDLRKGEVVDMVYNQTAGGYEPSNTRTRSRDRLLIQSSLSFGDLSVTSERIQSTSTHLDAPSSARHRAVQSEPTENTPTEFPDIKGRVCPCTNPSNFGGKSFYCPTNQDFCAIPRGSVGIEPSCLNVSKENVFARSLWPILMVWFVMGVILLFFSAPGKNVRDGLLSLCVPRWNERIADNLIQNRIQLPVDLERVNRPQQLKLKTKRYTASDTPSSTGEEQGETGCSICFCGLEPGDRIGELPCNHIFHVDCLKGWLCRRNVCPLCLQPDVASPEFASPDESPSS